MTTTSDPEPTTRNPEPTRDPRVALLRDFFFNRRDKVAVRSQKGKKRTPFPVRPEKGDLIPLLNAHVLGKTAPEAMVRTVAKDGCFSVFSGHFRVGSYVPALNGTTRWLCLDFDGAGHSNPLRDARGAALATVQNFYDKKIPCYLERSGGGHGYHVWVFFSSPVPASDARALGFKMACRKAPLQKGGFADPERGQGIEVFPKQEKVSPKGLGNMVFLPWWSGAPGGANQFYPVTPEGLMGADAFIPEKFDALSPEDLDWIIAEIHPEPAALHGKPTKQDWQAWQQDALKALPLDAVYGQWLTGETSGPGWLQCRDPFSPTGDQNPSAGVATGEGDARRGSFHSFISGKTLDVFDFLRESGRASTFNEAKALVADLSGVPFPTGQSATHSNLPYAATPHATDSPPAHHPPNTAITFTIKVNDRPLRDVIEESWRAVHATNRTPTLFLRGHNLARIRHDLDDPCIEEMDETAVIGHLARISDWKRETEEYNIHVVPPREVAKDFLVNPSPHLPRIDSLVSIPVFGASGTLLQQPGFHAGDRVWHEPHRDLNVPPVPGKPTDEDLTQARDLFLNDLLVDFPFVASADAAHFLAAALLPFIRRLIPGPTPLHVIEAPTAGSGKGMLSSLINIIATGATSDVNPLPEYEDERRKTITTILMSGKPIVLLDNASQNTRLNSAVLAAALTSQVWTDRLLGKSQKLYLPNKALWLLTGNNPQLTLELARRCVRIRIDPNMDRPWRRQRFKHPDLQEWCRENRSRLIHALLTMVQAWIAKGKPQCKERLGSFEHWAAVTGGILEVAGIPGFLGNLDTLYEEADDESQMWRSFTLAWWRVFGPQPKRPKELNDLCNQKDLLNPVRGDKSPRSQETRLGFTLNKMRDRVFGEFRIVRVSTPEKGGAGVQYALLRTGGPNEDGPETLKDKRLGGLPLEPPPQNDAEPENVVNGQFRQKTEQNCPENQLSPETSTTRSRKGLGPENAHFSRGFSQSRDVRDLLDVYTPPRAHAYAHTRTREDRLGKVSNVSKVSERTSPQDSPNRDGPTPDLTPPPSTGPPIDLSRL